MQRRFATLALPTILAALSFSPATAQIRIGVELPSVHIRIAPDPPPPIRIERQMERPGRDHIWIDGYWDRQDDRWAWTPGHWDRPSHQGARWIKPQYRREGGAYRYEPGRWSHQRLEEGEDYSRWRNEHGRGHQKHGGNKKGERDDHRRDD